MDSTAKIAYRTDVRLLRTRRVVSGLTPYCACAVAYLLPCCFWTSAIAEEAESGSKELVEFLLEKHEQARRELASTSVAYRFSSTREGKVTGRELSVSVHGEVRQLGSLRFSQSNWDSRIHYKALYQKREIRCVVGHDFFAEWRVGTRNAYVRAFADMESLRPENKIKLKVASAQDYLLFGLGLGQESWRDAYRKHPDVNRWTAEERTDKTGGTDFVVKRFTPYTLDPEQPDLVFIVEPERGFSITKATFYGRHGELFATIDTAVVLVDGPGREKAVWLPSQIHFDRYIGRDDTSGTPGDTESTVRVDLYDFQLDVSFLDNQFSIDSLELSKGTHVITESLSGDHQSHVYIGGGFVPLSIWAQFSVAAESVEELHNLDSLLHDQAYQLSSLPPSDRGNYHNGDTGSRGPAVVLSIVFLCCGLSVATLWYWKIRRSIDT